MHEHHRIREQYLLFARRECRGYSPHYEELATAVAGDEWLLAFLAPHPVVQPNLLFAAVQFLTGPEEMPRTAAELLTFLSTRGEEVSQLMHVRRTQTNEIGRCAAILPALPAGPLALVEVGASAGLCLLLDAFRYEYGEQQLGDPASPVCLRCEVEGDAPIPERVPETGWRAGLDRALVDLHNEADARWLLACVWPEHAERRERLAAAMELGRSRGIEVERGDLTANLPALLRRVPPDLQLVVFHSAVLAYVKAEQRAEFAALLVEYSRQRPIVWISNEGRGVVPEITALAVAEESRDFLLGRTLFTEGRREDELLAIAHPHGASLRWLAPNRG